MVGIRKGDYYSLRNAPEEALAYYLSVAEKLPDDIIVKKKIAHTYYLMKSWKQAYAYAVQVPISEQSETEQAEMFRALFSDETEMDRVGELYRFQLGTGVLDYYKFVDFCFAGYDGCSQFARQYTGSSTLIEDLKNTLVSAEKISSDPSFLQFNFALKLYEQGMYLASYRITKKILEVRPDYFEVQKLAATNLYQLGRYEESKKIYLEYLEKYPNDMDVIIALWEIFFHLKDPVTSNLYLNNAILSGDQSKTDIERRLAYNYAQLGDTQGLLKVLNYLLQESEVKEDDFAVAVTAALEASDLERAKSWSETGMRAFPGSVWIGPLYSMTLRYLGRVEDARVFLDTIDEKSESKNPSFRLEKAIVSYMQGDLQKSKEILEELTELEEWPDIATEATSYLEVVNNELSLLQSWSTLLWF